MGRKIGGGGGWVRRLQVWWVGGNQSVDSPEKHSGASSLPLERTTPDAPPKHTVDVMREVMCFLLITPPAVFMKVANQPSSTFAT